MERTTLLRREQCMHATSGRKLVTAALATPEARKANADFPALRPDRSNLRFLTSRV